MAKTTATARPRARAAAENGGDGGGRALTAAAAVNAGVVGDANTGDGDNAVGGKNVDVDNVLFLLDRTHRADALCRKSNAHLLTARTKRLSGLAYQQSLHGYDMPARASKPKTRAAALAITDDIPAPWHRLARYKRHIS